MNLYFLTADPNDYHACTGRTAIPDGTCTAFDAQSSPGADYDYWLGLDAQWLHGVSATHGYATLTVTVMADV